MGKKKNQPNPWAPSSFAGGNVPGELGHLLAKATSFLATSAWARGCSRRHVHLFGEGFHGVLWGWLFPNERSLVQGCSGGWGRWGE